MHAGLLRDLDFAGQPLNFFEVTFLRRFKFVLAEIITGWTVYNYGIRMLELYTFSTLIRAEGRILARRKLHLDVDIKF